MVITIIGATILLVGILVFITYVWFTDMREIKLFQRSMLTIISILITPLLIIIELPKIKVLILKPEGLVIKNLVFGKTKSYSWNEFDGYQTTSLNTFGGSVTEIMLIANNKVVFEVSSNYIKNYDEMARIIEHNLKSLGPIEYNALRYLKQRLFR